MRKTIKITIIILSFIAMLFGGFLVGGSCRASSSAGGFVVDISPIASVFGLILLIFGLWGLIANIKKQRKILLRGIVIYGALLCIFCFYVNRSSAAHLAEIYKGKEEFVSILPPNDVSVLIALVSVMILLVYPFFKYESDKNKNERI